MQFIGEVTSLIAIFLFLKNLKDQSGEYFLRFTSEERKIVPKMFFVFRSLYERWWVMTYSAIHFFQEYFALYQSRYILWHTYILILNKIISELHYYLLFSIFKYTYIIEFATDIYHSAKCICINYASLKIGITIFLWIHKQKRNSSFFSKHFCA